MHRLRNVLALATSFFVASAFLVASAANAVVADRVYRNAIIFTADSAKPQAEALAIRDGKIIYVGSQQGLNVYVGAKTRVVDLKGRFLMPGIIDGHMHPLEAGTDLLKCDLNYESLTVAELQRRVQLCLDKPTLKGPDAWLEVVHWFQESMIPAGVKTSHEVLDVLKTQRPILLTSSFGHTVLANTRALALANITAASSDPIGGKIWRDAKGAPTGLLEDAAFEVFATLVSKPTAQQNVDAAVIALKAMNKQGVTSFLDAIGRPEDLAAFTASQKAGQLTVRAHFAPLIEPSEAGAISAAVARIVEIRKQYDQGPITRAAGITVRNAKLFLDGVIAVPAFTGAVLDPYLQNVGSVEKPQWIASTNRGPAVYFPPEVLAKFLVALGRVGIDPHMHADGDGAVHAALDAIAVMRKELPNADIRPAIAHDELVAPADFTRFKMLDAIPVLSMQWQKPAGDTLTLRDYFGPERMKILEPAGLLANAGARIAFGSDWPVDALDEWFAFKVGVTRTSAPDGPVQYRGRLGDDPGLSRETVLRAATINAAYELHQDTETGSLEVGKYADMIILDRNPLTIPAEEIANTRVLQTLVGGKIVYEAK